MTSKAVRTGGWCCKKHENKNSPWEEKEAGHDSLRKTRTLKKSMNRHSLYSQFITASFAFQVLDLVAISVGAVVVSLVGLVELIVAYVGWVLPAFHVETH